MVDSSHEPEPGTPSNRQPRDSRLDSFLRQAEGILAAQGQWNVEAQVKLKTLANELKLPPALFATALSQLGDPANRGNASRWEQAYREYLQSQFQQLPGGILTLPKERKAIAYGQQKFQLTPDACERCLTDVANQMQIARISDAQTLEYARSEIKRLVATVPAPPSELQIKVNDLAERWGLEEHQTQRLLTAELALVATKKRRVFWRRTILQIGTVTLSVTLIVCIILLGRILTTSATRESDKSSQKHTTPAAGKSTGPTNGRPAELYPPWWAPTSREFGELLQKHPVGKNVFSALASEEANVRRVGYRRLWELLAVWDQNQLESLSDQPRWLRQPVVQEAMLHCFLHDPDATTIDGWIDGANHIRWPSSLQNQNRQNQLASHPSLLIVGNFLNAVAADNLLLRAIQRVATGKTEAGTDGVGRGDLEPADRFAEGRVLDQRWSRLRQRLPELTPSHAVAMSQHIPVEQLRSRWLAQNMERLYRELQHHWASPSTPPRETVIEPGQRAALKNAAQIVTETIQLEPDVTRRSQLLALWWSALAGIDSNLAAEGWGDIEKALPSLGTPARLALIESWSVSTSDSSWDRNLSEQFSQACQDAQTPLTQRRAWDAVLIQKALGCKPVPSAFQTALRQRAALEYLDDTNGSVPQANVQEPGDWLYRSRAVTLALAASLEIPYDHFDSIVMQVTRTSASKVNPSPTLVFVPDTSFQEAWTRGIDSTDLPRFREAVGQLGELIAGPSLLTERQSRSIIAHLASDLPPEKRAAWRLALAGQPNINRAANQQSNAPTKPGHESQPLLGQLLQQPLFAQALANCLREQGLQEQGLQEQGLQEQPLQEQPTSLSTQLSWLGTDTVLTMDDQALRRYALTRLDRWDWEHGSTDTSQMARHYATVFEERYHLLRAFGVQIPTANSSPPAAETDWVFEVVLEHDDFCRALSQSASSLFAHARSTPQVTADWYQNHQQLVESQSDAKQALRVAEESLLQLFKQRLQKTATSW